MAEPENEIKESSESSEPQPNTTRFPYSIKCEYSYLQKE